MKAKGFTLIELLAVIVILAIIALIAVPIILGIIGDSKEQGNKRSIDMYADSIKNAIAKASLTGEVPSGRYRASGKTLTKGEYTLTVEYNGNEVICETTELYSDGTIYLDECTVGGEDVDYTYGKKKYYKNGEVVYFDVKLGTSCTNYIEANSATGYKGIETPTEENNNCLKFYAFLDDEKSETLNLLLDHNTTATVAWVFKTDYNDDTNYGTYGNTNKGPLTILNQLKTDTTGWTGVTELTTNDTYTPSKMYNNGDPYTINYNKYRARIISAEEIAKITENDSWTIGDSVFYFDSLKSSASATCKSGDITGCKYGWLYDRTSTSCTTYGCLKNSSETTYGYWTVSANSSNSSNAWYVDNLGNLSSNYVRNSGGVRPVIEVLKSQLS